VDPTDATTTGITIGGCRPGKFKIEHRIRTEYEVFEDNSVVIRGFNTHETEPEELEDFRDLDG
jgi:hypothetical protein